MDSGWHVLQGVKCWRDFVPFRKWQKGLTFGSRPLEESRQFWSHRWHYKLTKIKQTFFKTREDVKKLNKKLKLKIENGKNVLVRLWIQNLSNATESWYSNHLNDGLVWYLNGWFVSSCQIVRYSNRNEKRLFMVRNVRYLNGPPSHVTLSFEYWTPILTGI